MAYNYVTLSGTVIGAGNGGVTAKVEAVPSNWLTLTDQPAVMAPQGFVDYTDSNGNWTLVLLSTDSEPISPDGWFWTLTTRAEGVLPTVVSFFLPFSNGSAQDITDQSPLTTAEAVPPTYLSAQSASQVAAAVAGEAARATTAQNIALQQSLMVTQAAAQSGGLSLCGLAGATANVSLIPTLSTFTFVSGIAYGQVIFCNPSASVNGFVSLIKWTANAALRGTFVALFNSSGTLIGTTADLSAVGTNTRAIRVAVPGFTQTPADGVIYVIYTNSTGAAGGPGVMPGEAFNAGNPASPITALDQLYFVSTSAIGMPTSLTIGSQGVPTGFLSANAIIPVCTLD